MQQQTLKSPCHIHGIGLHSGAKATVSLLPAPVDSGVVFRVNDGERHVDIPARAEFVEHTNLSTSLGRDGLKVGTVEHLLAALTGLSIDKVQDDGELDEKKEARQRCQSEKMLYEQINVFVFRNHVVFKTPRCLFKFSGRYAVHQDICRVSRDENFQGINKYNPYGDT